MLLWFNFIFKILLVYDNVLGAFNPINPDETKHRVGWGKETLILRGWSEKKARIQTGCTLAFLYEWPEISGCFLRRIL